MKTLPENITITVLKDNEIELCRDLCNELMAFQKEQAVIHKENFDKMNFETRMKPSYNGALEKQALLIRDGDTPIGYAFNSVEIITEQAFNFRPDWVNADSDEELRGFYPEGIKYPTRVGTVNNLYFRPEYRGMGLGKRLVELSLEWFAEREPLGALLVHVSNGNINAQKLYEKCGFAVDHQVFGGFITAMSYPLEKLPK